MLAGVSKATIAGQVGRTAEMIRQYEAGLVVPPADVLARYAMAVSCPVSVFFAEPEQIEVAS